jgi:hypothetical protein
MKNLPNFSHYELLQKPSKEKKVLKAHPIRKSMSNVSDFVKLRKGDIDFVKRQ